MSEKTYEAVFECECGFGQTNRASMKASWGPIEFTMLPPRCPECGQTMRRIEPLEAMWNEPTD